MGFFASVNGNVVPIEEARVSILDNGFTFGDSVYETLRTYRGRPFALGRHLTRLRASADRLGFDIPFTDAVLAARLDAVLSRAENPESYIRLIVTRGVGDISYRFERVKGPTVVMAVKPYDPYPEGQYREGISVAVVSIRRNHPQALDPAIKSGNLLNNILAMREAQARGAEEPVLLNDRDEITEGASTNLFIVKGGTVLTPPLAAGILAGVTRAILFDLLPDLGLPVREQTVRVPDLLAADEAFLTSTTRETVPIRAVDGTPIGEGRPGPLTRRVLEAFRAYAPLHSH
ncbi:MAG TPA: aminotransferase class IV [Vicinamibacteria bacterium]|nr:aminotransferase class IV [Vicinamibacteria bacterium]